MARFTHSQRALLALAALLLLAPARGEDWPQFRRDAARTGASGDRIALPLTELWSAPGRPVGGLFSMHHTAAWQGRLFFVAGTRAAAMLFCVDARTGVPHWRQALLGEASSPAVTAGGIVLVSEGALAPGLAGLPHRFRAFRATDGQPVATCTHFLAAPAPCLLAHTRADLLQARNEVGALSPGPHPIPALALEPAVVGEGVVALSRDGWLIRWNFGEPARGQLLGHVGPRAGNSPMPPAEFMGAPHPLAVGGEGMLIAGTSSGTPGGGRLPGFTAFVTGAEAPRWHRDDLPLPGSVAIDPRTRLLFAAVPGGVLALDPLSGATRWAQPAALGRSRPNPAALVPGSGGCVLVGSRVFFATRNGVAAADAGEGELLWQQEGLRGPASSLIATREHLFLRTRDAIAALRLEDGRLEWLWRDAAPGSLSAAGGLIFDAGPQVRAFAPAERTFSLAIDSARASDYAAPGDPAQGGKGAGEQGLKGAGEQGGKGAGGQGRKGTEDAEAPGPLADASILRLRWDGESAELVKLVRERLAAAPGIPLALSLEWLDETRARLVGPPMDGGWTPETVASFARLCEQLASVAKPAWFDVAPEVNVYLAREAKQAEAVLGLVQAAARAVRKGSPGTKVLVSLNVEVLAGLYGRAGYLPYGRFALPRQPDLAAARALADAVDAIGLSTCPQAAFAQPAQIPGDYLLALKAAIPGKPLLITRLLARGVPRGPRGALEQAAFLKRLFQVAYWLDAPLVAYPELRAAGAGDERALFAGDQPRPALAVWRDVLAWKRVARLTAAAPAPASPPPPAP